jgi:hypothetical protein
MIKGLEIINLIILPLLLVVYVLPVAVSHLETQDQGPMPVPYHPPQSYSSASTNMPAIKDDVKVPPINILQSSGDPRPGMMETSEYMIGKVGVLIIFVESTGRIDPNMEDWQDWRMVQVEQGIYRALWWWRSQYPFGSPKLEFYVNRNRIIGYTDYEPIIRPHTDERLWVPQILSRLGCGSGENHYIMAKSCADQTRKSWGMDWAFIIFVIDSYNDADGAFADATDFGWNWFAYAYLNGPYLVVTYDNNGWGVNNMDRVVAHEIGHIFGATDEYNGKPEQWGYLYEWDVDGSRCIMDTSEWCISVGTRRQIGWVDDNRNGFPDVLENRLSIEVTRSPKLITDNRELVYEGKLILEPVPCRRPNCRSVTINKISAASYTLDCGRAGVLTNYFNSTDGLLDSPYEEFSIRLSVKTPGWCKVRINAEDSLHFSTATYVSEVLYTYVMVVEKMSSALKPRVDVGTPVRIGFKLVWAHDNSPVQSGEVLIGGVKSTALGDGWFEAQIASTTPSKSSYNINYAALQLSDYTISKVENNIGSVEVIWDRIIVELSAERSRIDVGSEAIIRAYAYYETDGLPVPAKIYLNQPTIQHNVGKYAYTAVQVQDELYGLKIFKSNTIEIIWDRVRVELVADRYRVDVGREAPIKAVARYEYDGTTFRGKIIIYPSLKQDNVGKYTYKAVRIQDDLYGLSTFVTNSIDVVFDRVVLELRPVLDRVEVGRAAQIKISRSYYEFDGQEFQGDVFLDKNLVQHQMGPVTFKVAGIRDSKYGLTVYKSNDITVIFDKLSVLLNIQTPPFLTNIHVKVFYQYDGAPVTKSEVLAMGEKLSQDPKSAGLYTASFLEFSPYISGKVLVNTEGFETLRLDYSQPHIGNVLTYSAVSAAAPLLFFVKRKKTKTYKPRTKV